MSLIQPAPSAHDDSARPPDVPPDRVMEMEEEEWYEKVYRGADAPQLTIRAITMGSVLGFLLAFTNLYVGLKTGWGLGVAITAAILSYGIWTVMLKAGVARSPMSILETNCMQSTASSAGYATVGTIVSAISALLMLSATDDNPQGEHLPWMVLGAWTLFQAALGTVLAIPMKRNLINREKLKFPSGTAAAVTLYSLYSEGATALKKAKLLVWTMLGSSIFPLLIDLQLRTTPEGKAGLVPADSKIFDWLPARGQHAGEGGAMVANKPSDWTMVMDHNPVMVGAGMIVGLRVTVSMLVAGLALAYVVGPFGAGAEWVSPVTGKTVLATSAPYKAWKEIGLWLGVPIMVSSGLLAFAMQWRTILRAFQGIGGKGSTGTSAHEKLVAETEVPFKWFAVGTVVSGAGCIAIAAWSFGVPWYYGVLAVAMTFVLCLVACRATGESDITPVGAMGKIMQLTYGVLIPQSTTANLMTASITASAAGSAADLLNDLKSGYLLGANPRRQFMAQVAGIFSGTIATVGGFYLLVPDATALTGAGGEAPDFPAPAAQTWKAVAEVFKFGFANMHPVHQQAILVGLVIGAVLLAVESLAPKNVRGWLPSATGIGLGLILPFQYPLSMFLGAVVAALWTRGAPRSAEEYLVPASAGIIAGVSIMGVIVAFLNNVVMG